MLTTRFLSVRLTMAWAALLSGLAALTAAGGCTRLPAAEFTAYRDSFVAARTAGEQVLLDYSAAQRQVEAIRAETARAAEPAELSPDRPRWSRESVLGETGSSDDVGQRLKAWALVGSYNDALTALAEGRPADQLGAEFDSFAGALRSFPWEALGDKAALIASSVGGAVGPAITLAQDLIVQAKREADRRRFLAAIDAGAPLIHGLLDLLGEDADYFWSTRYGLYDRDYTRTILRRVGTLARTANQAVQSGGRPDDDSDAQQAVTSINDALSRLREYRDSSLRLAIPAEPAEGYTPESVGDLVAASVSIAQLADQADALDAQLTAYEGVLTEYVRLLRKLDTSLEDLRLAAANPEHEIPSAAELAALVIRVRRAMVEYERAR